MHVVVRERTAGEPGMAGALGADLPLSVDCLPGLLADDHMQAQMLAARLGELVVDGVDPGELLAALAPGVSAAVLGL
jgi:hypothetical protein